MTDLILLQGKTFNRVLRLSSLPYIYKPITGITAAAPAVITAVGHGVLEGQRVAIVSVLGMTQINATNTPLRASDYHKAHVIGVDSISLNDINAAGFSPYLSGGYLQYLTPVDLTAATARMSIKDSIGGVDLLDLTTTNGGIVIDNALKTITLIILPAASAALTWTSGVYDLEMTDNTGAISLLLSGNITVTPEVTTIE